MGNPWVIRRTVDLAEHEQRIERLCALATTSSRAAHQLRITLKADGKPVSLTGITAQLNLILHGESSLTVKGSISGSELVATLPAQCYAQEGDVQGVLMAEQGTDSAVPVYGFVLFIRADMTDVVVDPSHTIPSLSELLAQLDAARAAINGANAAAKSANTAAGNADTATAKANTAAAGADAKAKEAEKAAKKLSSVGVSVTMLESDATPSGTVTQTDTKTTFALNIPRGATGATGKTGAQGPKGDPGASNIRTVALSLAVSAWTGSGPYTATITRSDVTTKTWVDFNLSMASLANYAAAIDWSTETAGKIVLTTAVKPTGTIAGTLVLMEVM